MRFLASLPAPAPPPAPHNQTWSNVIWMRCHCNTQEKECRTWKYLGNASINDHHFGSTPCALHTHTECEREIDKQRYVRNTVRGWNAIHVKRTKMFYSISQSKCAAAASVAASAVQWFCFHLLMPAVAAKCVYEVDFIVKRSSVSMFGRTFSFFSSLSHSLSLPTSIRRWRFIFNWMRFVRHGLAPYQKWGIWHFLTFVLPKKSHNTQIQIPIN